MTTFEGRFEAEHAPWTMLARWGVAGALVVALHGAAAYALLNHVPLETPPAGAPEAAILIDLAPPAESAEAPPPPEATLPEPVAEPPPPEPMVEPTPPEPAPPEPVPPEPAPEPVVEPLPEPVAPEPVVEPLPEPEPMPPEPVEEPPPEPPVVEDVAPLPGNVPLPTLRPAPVRPAPEPPAERVRPPPERRVERRETPVRQPPRRQAPQPPASVAARGAPERQVSQGAQVSAASQDRWKGRVLARLNRFKRSLRGGDEGTVVVSFTIDGGGRITGARVVRSAGPVVDQAALALIQRAAPYPAPPEGKSKKVDVPIRFD